MNPQVFNYTFNVMGNSASSLAEITNNVTSMNTQINNSVNVFNSSAGKLAIFNQMAQGVQTFFDGLNNVLTPGAALNSSIADLSAISGEAGECLKTIEKYAREAATTFSGSALLVLYT
ncbi:MAG: hypothetical protein RR285_15505 [Acinetobacter sp.]